MTFVVHSTLTVSKITFYQVFFSAGRIVFEARGHVERSFQPQPPRLLLLCLAYSRTTQGDFKKMCFCGEGRCTKKMFF